VIQRLLVANRGEIALRVMRTASRMGIGTVAIYSEADADAPHVAAADRAEFVGEAPPTSSYLCAERVIAAARSAGADAVHPGYGFLSENADFAEMVISAGLTWIGPPPPAMRAMASKSAAKAVAEAAGVPTIPGFSGDRGDDVQLAEAAGRIGFPLMLKAAAGGGGRGMRLVETEADLRLAILSARTEATAAFGSGELLLERAIRGAKHVEVQVFADAHGNVVHLFDRDCSVQRRHQKLIEEAPAPTVKPALRERMGATACDLARSVGYVGAGTVEFLVEPDGAFWFLEMNTRLQVEHPVTEAITGLDLVEWQIRVARGERLPLGQDQIGMRGHAMEVRLCAEDPEADFMPQSGTISSVTIPDGIRADHALRSGLVISPYYDSMLGKLVAWGEDRAEALSLLADALGRLRVSGVRTNRAFLRHCLRHPVFAAGTFDTDFLAISEVVPPEAAEDDALTLAAAALVLAEGGATGKLGWSNAQWLTAEVLLEHRGRLVGHEVSRTDAGCEVRVGERTRAVTVSSFDDGRFAGRLDGERFEAGILMEDDLVWIETGDVSLVVRDLSRCSPAGQAGAGEQQIKSPMAGRVVRIEAAPGTEVRAGDTVLVVEAMKMEHRLLSKIDGRVVEILVREGDQVPHSGLLAKVRA
jgi:acetyl/propionyl-CoA carboxylase alpha subunit